MYESREYPPIQLSLVWVPVQQSQWAHNASTTALVIFMKESGLAMRWLWSDCDMNKSMNGQKNNCLSESGWIKPLRLSRHQHIKLHTNILRSRCPLRKWCSLVHFDSWVRAERHMIACLWPYHSHKNTCRVHRTRFLLYKDPLFW